MKHVLLTFALCISLLISCDEDSNVISSSDPDQDISACFTIEEVSVSECPAELLTNICSTYSCNFRVGNIEADGSFPPCPGDPGSCQFVDCTTLLCGGLLRYDISVGEGSLGYRFDTVDQETGEPIQIGVVCFDRGIFTFTCGDDGTIFN